jgi:hypothetical protein
VAKTKCIDKNYKLTNKEKLKAFYTANWRSKLLWIIHPTDTWGKHLERYYNNPKVKKNILSFYRG